MVKILPDPLTIKSNVKTFTIGFYTDKSGLFSISINKSGLKVNGNISGINLNIGDYYNIDLVVYDTNNNYEITVTNETLSESDQITVTVESCKDNTNVNNIENIVENLNEIIESITPSYKPEYRFKKSIADDVETFLNGMNREFFIDTETIQEGTIFNTFEVVCTCFINYENNVFLTDYIDIKEKIESVKKEYSIIDVDFDQGIKDNTSLEINFTIKFLNL